MREFIDVIVSNGTVLFVGVTLLLAFGCLAVATHRSPVHRQRLAEFAIASTLIWLILAVTPLPRPLARGFFVDLSKSISQKAPTPSSPAEPEKPLPDKTHPSLAASAPPAALDLVQTLPLLTTGTMNGVVLSDQPSIELGARQEASTTSKSLVFDVKPREATIEPASAEVAPATLTSRTLTFLRSNWKFLLLGVYGVGIALCAGWILLGRGLLAFIVRTSKTPEYWLNELFADLCEERGTLNVWLVLSDRYPRAMSFGIRRPTIVMPSAICVPENAEILRHVLRHELVHVGRRDAWGTLLFNVSFLFLFFHPAFWWLRSRARMSAELVADEWAATRSSRDEYARELIAFVRATRSARFLPAGATGVLGSTTPFSRRIEMLVRRERPLVMHSSPAWRIASCGMLGLLIVGMAASLGRTAQDETEVTKKIELAEPEQIVVRVEDDDSAANGQDIELTEVIDVEDDSADKHVDKLAQKYEMLVRRSAELQKQIAELRKVLAESKATAAHGQKSGHYDQVRAFTLKDGKLIDAETLKELGALKELKGLESLKEIKELKGLESLKELEALKGIPHVMQFDVKVLEDAEAESKSDDKSFQKSKELKKEIEKAKKHTVIIKSDKMSKGEKAGDKHNQEEAIIELKTDDGEILIEVGPDHVAKVKKLKGFGKDSAELERALKALKGADVGIVPGDLKALIESAKSLHHGHVDRQKMKHENSDSSLEQSEEQHFKVQSAPAIRAKVEAQHRVLRELKQQLGKMHEMSESSESAPKGDEAATEKKQQRHVIVKAVPSTAHAAGILEKTVRAKVLRESGNAATAGEPKIEVFVQEDKEGGQKFKVSGDAITLHEHPRHLAKIVEERTSSAALAAEGPTDLMRLAELVSNAVGELEQAKAALEDAQGNLNVAQARVKSAERKVRLLSRIAQSVHTVVAAQAKRLHELREKHAVPASAVEEIDSKLRIIDLILADVKTAGLQPAVSTMTVSESSLLAVPALPARPAAPVSALTSAAPRPAIAPTAPKVSVAPKARSPVAVASVLSVTPVAPKVAVTPVAPVPAKPAAPATPAKAVAPAAPAKTPAKPSEVRPQSSLTKDFSFFVGQTR